MYVTRTVSLVLEFLFSGPVRRPNHRTGSLVNPNSLTTLADTVCVLVLASSILPQAGESPTVLSILWRMMGVAVSG